MSGQCGKESLVRGISVLSVPLDRFASVGPKTAEPKSSPASVLIKPTMIELPCLSLNVNESSGRLAVELLPVADEAFLTTEALPGYGKHDMDTISNDGGWTGCVRWRGADLTHLVGKVVQIKFLSFGAELYAFTFRPTNCGGIDCTTSTTSIVAISGHPKVDSKKDSSL